MISVAPDILPMRKWFIDNRVASNPISAAEARVCSILSRYPIRYYREVSFYGLVLPTGGYGRYDFYIPELNWLIEYDSVLWHSDDNRKWIDMLKSEYAINAAFVLTRFNRHHWGKLDQCVDAAIKVLTREYKR